MRNFPKLALTAGVITVLSFSVILLSSWKSPQLKKGKPEDTTKTSADKKKSSKYSRTTIITFDEKGEPHEKIIEDFEGDEEWRDLMKSDSWFNNFDVSNVPPVPGSPSIPDFPSVPGFPALPSFPDFPADVMFPPMPPMLFDMDTIDFKRFHFGSLDFERLGEDFAMMEDRFKEFGPEFEASMEHMQEQLEKMDFELNHQLDRSNRDMEMDLNRLHETLDRDLRLDLDKLNEELEVLQNSWTEGVKEFEKEAREELIKDGYLEKSEKIESMLWSDDEIKFNNKTIKPEHVDKYRKMQKKHTKRNRYIGRPE